MFAAPGILLSPMLRLPHRAAVALAFTIAVALTTIAGSPSLTESLALAATHFAAIGLGFAIAPLQPPAPTVAPRGAPGAGR